MIHETIKSDIESVCVYTLTKDLLGPTTRTQDLLYFKNCKEIIDLQKNFRSFELFRILQKVKKIR